MFSVDVKCKKLKGIKKVNEPVKCELITEKAKVEYYFENLASSTMYPKKIDVFKKNFENEHWDHFRQIKYVNFTVQSNGKQTANGNLPPRLGCKRIYDQKYYNLNAAFKSDFHFDYDLTFNYTDVETKELVSRKYPGSMYFIRSPYFPDDPEFGEFVNHGVTEYEEKKMISFYDGNAKIFYDIASIGPSLYCRPNRFYKRNNFFYLMDLFAKNKGIFEFWNQEYSYLGSWKVDGKKSLVYEKIIGFGRKMTEENKSIFENGHGKNKNKIISEYMIANYYYHLTNETGFIGVESLTMPFKMKFNLLDDKNKEVGKLVLDVKNYSQEVKEVNKIIEPFKNCIKKSQGYDQFTFIYTDRKEKLKGVKNLIEQTDQNIKKHLYFIASPLRAFDLKFKVLEDVGDQNSSILVNFKLYEPINPEYRFEINHGKDFEKCVQGSETFESIFPVELCGNKCLGRKDCGAYSYDHSTKICKLCKIKNFNKLFDESKFKIDFSQFFETINKKRCELGKRSTYFVSPKHKSNDDIIKWFRENSKYKLLDLHFRNGPEFFDEVRFRLKEMKIKRIEGN